MKKFLPIILLVSLAATQGCGPAQLVIAGLGGAAGGGGAAAVSFDPLVVETQIYNESPTISNLTGPENGSSDLTPTFQWIGNDIDGFIVSYQLQVDCVSFGETAGMSWTSPMLGPGTHVFTVVAVDTEEGLSEPATWTWDMQFDCGLVTVPLTVPIAGGTFTMGDDFGIGNSDEIPLHDVALSGFEITGGEITTLQFAQFLNAGFDECYRPSPEQTIARDGYGGYAPLPGRENDPAVFVDWEAAGKYCAFISRITGASWRLPTEAEWEYAARGGHVTTLYPGGDSIDGNAANYRDSGDIYETGVFPWTSPVGVFPPAGFGLYDMAGNVWEWCSDFHAENYYQVCADAGTVTDPGGPDSGTLRVIRGGSWNTGTYSLRCARRYFADPGSAFSDIGFRCVRETIN